MAKNLYFTQGTRGEQNLVQDLIDEQIKIYGLEVYYIPRKIYEDKLWNDIYYSQFKDSYLIEMYLENFESFGGNSDMLSKFGLRVTDEVTLTVSRRRWKDFVDLSTNKIVGGRPNDGDLIWFPLNKTVFEIKYVENQKPFYQLNNLYVYTLTCEIFEYGDTIFDTGIPEIDNTEAESGVYPIVFNVGGSGNYVQDEKITGTRFNATATAVTLQDGVLGPITVVNQGGKYETAPNAFFYTPNGTFISTATTEITDGKVTKVNAPDTPYTYGDITYDQQGNITDIDEYNPIIKIEESPGNIVAKVATWDPETRTLNVAYTNGNFDINEEIVGEDSLAKWTVSSYDTIDIVDNFYAENREIEDNADVIIDFTESNPFGEFGDMGVF